MQASTENARDRDTRPSGGGGSTRRSTGRWSRGPVRRVAAPARYFLATAPGSGEKPAARAFLDWLRAETAKNDAAGQAAAVVVPAAQGEG